VEVTTATSTISASAGSWLTPGTQFQQSFSEDAYIISIHFSCQWISGKSLFPPDLQFSILAESCPLLDRHAERLIKTMPTASPESRGHLESVPVHLSTFLKIEGAFIQWLSAWVEVLEAHNVPLTETPGVRSEVLRAIDYIRRLPPNAPFREQDVVHVAGLSRSALLPLYADFVGMTPREHHDYLKLEAAQTALEIGDGQIKSVAFELGFQSASQFSNWFRRRCGISPRDYRDRHQPLARA
jgi:AraC-like DNA-binding protein